MASNSKMRLITERFGVKPLTWGGGGTFDLIGDIDNYKIKGGTFNLIVVNVICGHSRHISKLVCWNICVIFELPCICLLPSSRAPTSVDLFFVFARYISRAGSRPVQQMPMHRSEFDGDAYVTVCIGQILRFLILL